MSNRLRREVDSFTAAMAGIKDFIMGEYHASFHLLAALVVLVLGVVYRISLGEWCLVVFCIISVLVAEIFNTAIEQICDVVQPQHDDRIRRIKDLSAGAVLLAAIGSLIIGVLIFVPKIIR